MKLTYLFSLFIAAIALLASCDDDNSITLLDEIQVSTSYVSLPMDGGSAKITVTAVDEWTAEKVVTKKDSLKWLSISADKGIAGETELTFTAPATLDGRSAEVTISSAGKTQHIKILQGLSVVSEAPVEDVIGGPDGKTFRLTGVCTSIANFEYGNWYITDETGSLYIYGTLDAKGNTKNFRSLGLEVGDEVTIEGPKSTYNGAAQMVNVTVIEIKKSYVKVDSVENAQLPLEGGEFVAHLALHKDAQGLSVEIPEDAKDWLSISSIQSAGTNSVVKFLVAPNAGGDRTTTITFSTTDGKKEYTTETSLSQKGAIIKASIKEFLAAEVGNTQYRLTGVITKIDEKYNNNLYIRDFSGETYVYKLNLDGNVCKVGDIITVVGKRAEYKGTPQVADAVLENVNSVTPATIAEVLAKPKSDDIYYMVTGEITSIVDVNFGNLYLKDETGEIYLYGCYPGYGATGDDRKGLIAAKGLKVGDKLTVIALKDIYKDNHQLAKGLYVSHESAE